MKRTFRILFYTVLLGAACLAFVVPNSISDFDREYTALSPTGMVQNIIKKNPAWKYKIGDMHGRASRSEEGIKWFLSAAEDGHAEAQYMCAKIYMHGIPGKVKENRLKALYWWDQAVESGHPEAKANHDKMISLAGKRG